MTPTLPRRSEVYKGLRTDSSRWDSFESRSDDVLICTPPKSGTTWTQAICVLLVSGGGPFDGALYDVSPWFDSILVPLETCRALLASQDHRRVIKTHTPLDGIPYFSECTYLAVYRDPRDAFLSMRSHLANTRDMPSVPMMDDDLSAAFSAWLAPLFEAGVSEQQSLAALAHHFSGFWRYRDLPNVHLLHFEHYKQNLRQSIARIAGILKIPAPGALLDEIEEAVSFESMRAQPELFAPAFGRGVWKDDAAFFNRGESAQWRAVLGEQDLQRYRQRVQELVPADAVRWLETGES